MNNKIILHIDMNSYFTSVEQQANPFLRGKAVGVCAYLSPGGCIIASSREAKAYGVKTGCTVRVARELAPRIVLLENEPAKYRSTTEKIFKILGDYTDIVEPYSIDEAFLDLTERVSDFALANQVGKKIQARIKNEVGEWLGSSIGISWTKFLAKFASDIAPKGGILVINKNNLDACLNRPLSDAWGIGERLAERLRQVGINNLLELKKYSSDRLRRLLGRYGYYLWANVNGKEIASISPGTPVPKSVGHSYCLPNKTKDKKYLANVFYKLTEKTGRRLRALNLEAQRLMIAVAYVRAGGVYKSFKTREKMFTTEEIYKQVEEFLEKTVLVMPARMLAVSVSALMPVSPQMSLLENNLAKKELSRALDKINDKYGEYTVIRGAMFGTNNLAKDRIGFRKPIAV
ncbi:MAG: DNA polymerase IV [Candidatus Falkowbacteria bacterium]|nr:DNA polymerase IV [Candidatus Falkowbacteria bacterium]